MVLACLFLFGSNPVRNIRWVVINQNVEIEEYRFFSLRKALKMKKDIPESKIRIKITQQSYKDYEEAKKKNAKTRKQQRRKSSISH